MFWQQPAQPLCASQTQVPLPPQRRPTVHGGPLPQAHAPCALQLFAVMPQSTHTAPFCAQFAAVRFVMHAPF